MGATLSRSHIGQQAEITKTWLMDYRDSGVKYAAAPCLEVFTVDGTKYLALAYQASHSSHAGSPSQHLRFCLSKDGGETWSTSRVAMWGIAPLWSPVLYYHSATSLLYLFYTESRKAFSPGGDVKYICSSDLGSTWSPPVTILTHEDDGEVPKVIASRPQVVGNTWYLGFHSEPLDSYKTFNAKTFTSLKEAEETMPRLTLPPLAASQSLTTSAGVLISEDDGKTWKVGGRIEDGISWLLQPSIEQGSKKQLVAFFRSATGKAFTSQSTDGGISWTKATPMSLPNPNSKFSTVTIDGQILMAYNPSATARTTLALALSVDDGRSWEQLVTIEDEAEANFSYPSIVEWQDDTVKLAYTVWGKGLKMATVKLATVEG